MRRAGPFLWRNRGCLVLPLLLLVAAIVALALLGDGGGARFYPRF